MNLVKASINGDSSAGHAVVTTAIGTALAALATYGLNHYAGTNLGVVETGALAVVFSWLTSLVGQQAA